jgi:Raf kinase inhibitor-like YbhB/YbcL family protein
VFLLVLASLVLSSSAFHAGGTIPRRYTCEGRNVSPPLRWTAPPRGTRSFALTVTDPDAPGGTFVHWVAWGIAPSARSLGVGARPPHEGRNSAGTVGYTGPCPPPGPAHRYVFRLYALDARVGPPFGRHALASSVLVGRYAR